MAVLVNACSSSVNEDPFIGTFESESRANFGSGTPGEWRIEVVYLRDRGKYEAALYRKGTLIGKNYLVYCSEDKEDYLRQRPPGHAEVLCADDGSKFLHGFLSYAENGINVTVIKPKYFKDPSLVEKEGLKPGDPSLFEQRRYKAKYYAHAQWAFYGFRKVAP